MGLSAVLSNALSSLNVNQQALQVLSQNIANANTAGYSRQVINEQPLYINGQGQGVSIDTVTRQVDDYLVAAVRGQNSSVGSANTISDYNSRIQVLLGQPGSSNSIDSFINTFFNNVQSLAQSPTNVALQQTVVNSGVTLATQVQGLAQGLQKLQFQADGDIGSSITTVNNDLQSIYQLNAAIAQGMAYGQSVAGLQDKRDQALNDLASYIGIQTFVRSDGSISVTTSGGAPLVDTSLYKLSYSPPASSPDVFSNGASLSPITITRLDENGNPTGSPITLVSGGTPSQVTSLLSGGSIQALIDMRDQEIPDIMGQLDALAATVRDQFNAIQNSGSGFPGANSFTGTRAVNSADYNSWTGNVRIAVLDSNGNPLSSPYTDETNGLQPLTLDLSTMNSSQGYGNPTVQDIVNAINQYYGVPQNKVELGNLNNIQLASDSSSLPGVPTQLKLDFNLNNISSTSSNFFVTGVTVQDSNGVTMSPASSTVPSVALASTNTYQTNMGSNVITINTANTNDLTNGETVYLSTPSSPATIGGINSSEFGGYYTISNVTATSFQITVADQAGSTASADVSGQTASPPYATVASGQTLRTNTNGIITTDLSTNSTSPYYTVTVNVGVDDGTGNIKTSQITYHVTNQINNTLGTLYGATSANGNGTLVAPVSSQAIATAQLVDANGNPLPIVNGQYTTSQNGYLKITANGSTNVIAIDSLDSQETGKNNTFPIVAGTNEGFSSYFDLNNFFKSNNPTTTGDAVAGSALNFQVEQRLRNNPSLMALGSLTQNAVSSTDGPNFTYGLNAGDSSTIQRLATLSQTAINFVSAGGLPATTQTLSAYAGQIIAVAATNASTASTTKSNAQNLMDGYTQQAAAVSGVNLDTELANTVIYQNAYAASARIISVVGQLFDTLLQSF